MTHPLPPKRKPGRPRSVNPLPPKELATFEVTLGFNTLYELECMRHILAAGQYAVQHYGNRDLVVYAQAFEKAVTTLLKTASANVKKGMEIQTVRAS